MKLKVAILVSSLIFALNVYSEEVTLPWRVSVLSVNSSGQINTSKQDFFVATEDEALKYAKKFFPILISFPPISTKYSRQKILEFLSTNKVNSSTAYFVPTQLEPYCISNIVSGVTYTPLQLYSNSPEAQFIKNSLNNTRQTDKGSGLLLRENSLVGIKYISTDYYQCLINLDAFVGNVINTPEILTSDLISQNIEIIKNYLTQIGSNSSDLVTIVEAIEMNQLNTQSTLGNIIDKNTAITNLLYGIFLNSTYAGQHLQSIKDITSTFAEDQRIKQLASGQIVSTLNPTDTGGSAGVIYEALDQLVRLNYLKQGRNISDSELATMSGSDKWVNSGMAAKYGSYADNYNNGNMGRIVALEAVTENDNLKNKVSDLSSIADENGNVIDPLTGELTKLNDAIAKWDKAKTDGAIASYSYNNPAATNGFFGAIKRNMLDESDYRLLDKAHKDKADSFMDNITKSGIKINNSSGPVVVSVADGVVIPVSIPDEFTTHGQLNTHDAQVGDLIKKFDDWSYDWHRFAGIGNHNDYGYLDSIYEQNKRYLEMFDFAFDNLTNQLDTISEKLDFTNQQIQVTVPQSSYYRYYMKGIGTVENNDNEFFAIQDEPTFPYDGVTNFEQAVAYQLSDLFNVMQNGSKADMMSADFIRGIYRVLGTGSNLIAQVDYITNQVYNSVGVSTDPTDYDGYGQSLDELNSNLTSVNTTISEFHEQSKQRINDISGTLFADYFLPNKLVLLEFNDQSFEVDLQKYSDIFHMMHAAATVAWLLIGLLMLPRVVYMILCFSLKMLGKFYNIMKT